MIFALLDPDPDSESGSTDPIESGSAILLFFPQGLVPPESRLPGPNGEKPLFPGTFGRPVNLEVNHFPVSFTSNKVDTGTSAHCDDADSDPTPSFTLVRK